VDAAVLRDPRFWHGAFASQFTVIAQELDRDTLEGALGTSDPDVQSWWNDFTRSYDGVFDEADGYVDDPAVLTFALRNEVQVEIAYHPGGTFYRLRAADVTELLGEVGPHWRLPGLRWAELVSIARAADATGSLRRHEALLVLLPLVWPEAVADARHEQNAVKVAIEEAGIAVAAGANAIAMAWAGDVRGVGPVRWSVGANGPVNDSSNGTRGTNATNGAVRRLNEMIATATREADLAPWT
jgi:hypothetical protein